MDILEAIFKIFILVIFWLLFSSLFLSISFYLAKFMRNKFMTSSVHALWLSLLTSLLIAPVPTPIITLLVPFPALFLENLPNKSFFASIWNFAVMSLIVTWIASFLLISRYFKTGLIFMRKLLKSDP